MANKPFKKLRFSLTGDTYSPVDEQARQNIGDLSQLETVNKSNLVEAINEAAQTGGGATGVPSGGSKGQVLTKRSSVEGDADWEYPPIMTASGNDTSNLTVTWNENYTAFDFFSRQELLQAQYTSNLVVQLKLVKAYITVSTPDYNNEYHFEFGAITEIGNGAATIATLAVVCDSPSAHSGVGVYSEVEVGVSDEAVQEAVDNYLELHPDIGGTFTNSAKQALIALLQKVAYIDSNGETYLNTLINELFAVAVTSISAVFTQGSAVIYQNDSLDVLKQYLVVTATYADSSTQVLESSMYSLSGTLTPGTSTITVSYEGQTDTFTVVVSSDTTAQILRSGYVLAHYSSAPVYRDSPATNGGVTIIYELTAPTTSLYPAGIIATTGSTLWSDPSALYILDANDSPINYVSEAAKTGTHFNRWAQDVNGTMSEFSQEWTVAQYEKIQFSVDKRYLDDSYMYDKNTGQVWFAGVNTPYYGMSNISQATP